MEEAYLYQEPPDHYPDLITANGGTIAFTCQGGEGRLVFHGGGQPMWATIHATYVFGAVKDAPSTVNKGELMAFYMAHLLPDSIPPQAPQGPSATVSETWEGLRLRLTWLPVTQDVSGGQEFVEYYTVHRDTTAYFTPAVGNAVGQTGLTEYLDRDPSVVGNPAKSYFYTVRAVDMRGNTSANSATVGEVDFATGAAAPPGQASPQRRRERRERHSWGSPPLSTATARRLSTLRLRSGQAKFTKDGDGGATAPPHGDGTVFIHEVHGERR
jgi:hypothetical protein